MYATRRTIPLLLLNAVLCTSLCAALVACQTTSRVVLRVDGQDREFETTSTTVREALRDAGIVLGELDRVEPSLWAELGRNATIRVVRVRDEVQREEIPYARQVIRDEALPEGETRLLQSGLTGVVEATYRVATDGPRELERKLLDKALVSEPRPEILAVGVSAIAEDIPIQGSIAYLSNGNAWLVSGSAANRRPVTFTGDLDGRVFDLAPNGHDLLFTRAFPVDEASTTDGPPPFNELMAVDLRVLQEEPRRLGITNTLYAQWSHDVTQLAYSTAESVESSPGWRARNDLWIAATQGPTRTRVIEPSGGSIYGWWGGNYRWGPEGRRIAYATANEIELIDPATGSRHTLLEFPEFHTHSEWVWVPQIAWSPEGRYLACVVHAPSSAAAAAEESAAFDLWILDTTGRVNGAVAERVGMFANPVWSPRRLDASGKARVEIAYGRSQAESESAYGSYDLYIMDRDGSDNTHAFPAEGEPGMRLVDLAWSPGADGIACIWQGDIHIARPDGSPPFQLTRGLDCLRVAWEGEPGAGATP